MTLKKEAHCMSSKNIVWYYAFRCLAFLPRGSFGVKKFNMSISYCLLLFSLSQQTDFRNIEISVWEIILSNN